MILVSDAVVNLYISVWSETMRGRLDEAVLNPKADAPKSLKELRLAAQVRHNIERPILQIEHWSTIFEAAAGYEDSSNYSPYSGPRPYFGFRPVDDPDPRLFLVLTVETALSHLSRPYQALADHSWIFRRGDRDFRYKPLENEKSIVPRGRGLATWCKDARRRVIRPAIRQGIHDWMPETIVESTMQQIGAI